MINNNDALLDTSRAGNAIDILPPPETRVEAVSIDALFAVIADRDAGVLNGLLGRSDLDISVINDQGQTLFHAACAADNLPALQVFLAKCGAHAPILEALDRNGMTVLMHAAKAGKDSFLKALIDAGVVLDTLSRDEKYSALDFAVSHAHFRAREALANAGADVSFSIVLAANKRYMSTVGALQSRGGDLNDALLLAAERGFPTAISNLCQFFEVGVLPALKRCIDSTNLLAIETILQSEAENGTVSAQFVLMIQELFAGGLINVIHAVDDQRAKLPFSLLYATMAGHEAVINGLVHAGADPSLALQLAFEFPPVSIQVVDRLLSVGANINVKNAGGETMLMRAARVDGELVHQLHARGADIEAKDTRGYTPIMFAAEANNVEAINMLRLRGANVHAQAFYQSQSDPDGVPPRYYRNNSVMIAAERGNTDAISALLLHLPAADVARMVNARNSEGYTAVMLATQHKHLGAISILCQNGANTELSILDGLTPVLLAVERGYWEAVTVLAMFGADVNVRTSKDGIPAIMMAANRSDIAMIAALRDAGADINATDSMKRTALQLSVGRGAQLTCEMLLRLGANAHAKTSTNRTMLMLAAARGWVDIVHILIGHDVDVNAVDSYGETALMAGARGGHLDVVRELIRVGADHRVVDLQGMSAAKHAIQADKESDEMMALIGTDVRTSQSRFERAQSR